MELIDRARSGDAAAFAELVGPYRHEMQVHCYRILGSVADAEDALQETLAAAWQGLGGFEGRAALRTWLYRIATSRCLNMLRAARRRPVAVTPSPPFQPPEPTPPGGILSVAPDPPPGARPPHTPARPPAPPEARAAPPPALRPR